MFSVFNIICTKLSEGIVVFHKSIFIQLKFTFRIINDTVLEILSANGNMLVVWGRFGTPECDEKIDMS